MSAHLFAATHRFLGMQHAEGRLHAFAGREAFFIPGANRAASRSPLIRCPLAEQLLGVLQQQPVVSLDDHDHVLVVSQAKVDEGGIQVQRIAGNHVDEPFILREDPFQEPLGRRFLAFAGPLQFHIQGKHSSWPIKWQTTPR